MNWMRRVRFATLKWNEFRVRISTSRLELHFIIKTNLFLNYVQPTDLRSSVNTFPNKYYGEICVQYISHIPYV